MPLAPGQVLQDRYRIDALLGRGGMGAVYRAVDQRFGERVAIKENLAATGEGYKQFGREAQFLYRLRHQNLPRVIDYFFVPQQGQYLVMDYVDGEDLASILARRGALPEAEAVGCMRQVLSALAYLHAQNVIHRDVKPANIKITRRGQVFLVDFGLAKVHDSVLRTSTGARGMTPGYAPPEQYGQGRTDARSDIYSVGATLYALLTGQTPPDGVDRVMGTASLVPPRRIDPRISPQVEEVVQRAMQLQPAERFQTAGEFRAALSAAAHRRPETSRSSRRAGQAPAGERSGQASRAVPARSGDRSRAAAASRPRPARHTTPTPSSPPSRASDEVPVEHGQRDLTLWLAWVVVTVVGCAIGWLLGDLAGSAIGQILDPDAFLSGLFQALLLAPILALAMGGLGQWVVLRKSCRCAPLWLVTSLVTVLIGLLAVATMTLDSRVEGNYFLIEALTSVFYAGAFIQDVVVRYLSLRGHVRNASVWCWAAGAGLAVLYLLGGPIYDIIESVEPWWVLEVMRGGMHGLIYGMVTGVAWVILVRKGLGLRHAGG